MSIFNKEYHIIKTNYNDNNFFKPLSYEELCNENKKLINKETTPLHIACEKNDLQLIFSQINLFKQFIETKDINDNVPLFCVLKNEDISKKYCFQIINILYNNGCNINATNKYNQNILHQACLYQIPEIIEFLCQKHVDYNHLDIFSKTPIHYACEYGFIDNAIVLIMNGCLVHIPESTIQPLHILSLSNFNFELQIEFVKLLLENGADINSRHKIFRYTPLHSACLKNNLILVYFLLENGADPNIKQNQGNTPLHMSFELDVIKLLIEYGADINLTNNNNKKPIDNAYLHKKQQLIDYYNSLI